MATRGMTEFRADGVDYTVNDPNIAPEFNEASAYSKGDYVNYQGDLYRLTADHAANDTWANTSKTKIKLGAELATEKANRKTADETETTARENGDASVLNQIAPVFDVDTAYTKGQYVTYNGTLYRLTADHASGTGWSSTSKTAVKISAEMNSKEAGLESEVTDLKSALTSRVYELDKNVSDYLGNQIQMNLVKDYTPGYIDTDGSLHAPGTNKEYTTNMIEIESGHVYVYYCAAWSVVALYDTNGGFISRSGVSYGAINEGLLNNSFVTGTKYVRISCRTGGDLSVLRVYDITDTCKALIDDLPYVWHPGYVQLNGTISGSQSSSVEYRTDPLPISTDDIYQVKVLFNDAATHNARIKASYYTNDVPSTDSFIKHINFDKNSVIHYEATVTKPASDADLTNAKYVIITINSYGVADYVVGYNNWKWYLQYDAIRRLIPAYDSLIPCVIGDIREHDRKYYEARYDPSQDVSWTKSHWREVSFAETYRMLRRKMGHSNLFTMHDFDSYESDGITCTKLNDTTFKLHGTATANHNFEISNFIYAYNGGRDYNVSVSLVSGEYAGINFQAQVGWFYDTGTSAAQGVTVKVGEEKTLSVPLDAYYGRVYFHCENGLVCNNAVITISVVDAAGLNKEYLLQQTFNASFHKGATDFATKCTQFSTLLLGDSINNVTAPVDFETFLFFTDPHLTEFTGWENQCYEMISVIQKYYNSTPTSFCLCGGDWLGNSDLPSEACFKLGYIDGFMHSMFDKCYMIVGNHDTNYQGKKDASSATGTTELTPQSIADLWYRDEGKTYYRFDGVNTRFYCFDTGDDNNHSAARPYDIEQLKWFCSSLETDKTTHIAIFAHIKAGVYLCPILFEIAEAYNAGSTYTVDGDTYTFPEDHGKIEFYLAGHAHNDGNGIENGIPYIITTNVRHDVSKGPSFDLVMVDYDNRVFKCVRVGDGNDRDISLDTGELIVE